jgi:prepilin-type N-terminal cleavage/methylation domain-containing protein
MARGGPGARNGRAGFTLLEMLIVLAIIALSAALVLPRIGASIDRAMAFSEALSFERQVMDLRRQSFHERQGVQLVESGRFEADDSDPPLAEVQLSQGWTYSLSAPLVIDGGGACSESEVVLSHQGHAMLRLKGQGASCRFQRVLS